MHPKVNPKTKEINSEIKNQDMGDHSIYGRLIDELKTFPEVKGMEDKHLLNALIFSNGEIFLARERLSNKTANFCQYYDKYKQI